MRYFSRSTEYNANEGGPSDSAKFRVPNAAREAML